MISACLGGRSAQVSGLCTELADIKERISAMEGNIVLIRDVLRELLRRDRQ